MNAGMAAGFTFGYALSDIGLGIFGEEAANAQTLYDQYGDIYVAGQDIRGAVADEQGIGNLTNPFAIADTWMHDTLGTASGLYALAAGTKQAMSWLAGPADWIDEGLKAYAGYGLGTWADHLADTMEPDAKTNPLDANGPFHQLAALVQGANMLGIISMKDNLNAAYIAKEMPWMEKKNPVIQSNTKQIQAQQGSSEELEQQDVFSFDDPDDTGDVVVKPVYGVNLDALANLGGKGTTVLDLLAAQTYGVQLGYMFDTGRKSLGGVGIGLEALYRATNPTYLFSDVKQADFAQRYSAALSLTNLGLSVSGKWTMPSYDPTFNLSWKMPKINTTFSAMWSTSQIAPMFDFKWKYAY
jgi:hypothetical protein